MRDGKEILMFLNLLKPDVPAEIFKAEVVQLILKDVT
jgi:hypothetical protein